MIPEKIIYQWLNTCIEIANEKNVEASNNEEIIVVKKIWNIIINEILNSLKNISYTEEFFNNSLLTNVEIDTALKNKF